jgi:exopolysaccharide production protein ExoQ
MTAVFTYRAPRRLAHVQPAGHSGTGVGSTSWLARAFLAAAVIMTTSAFYFLFAAPADEKSAVPQTAAQSPAYLLLWIGLYAAAGIICLRDIMQRGIPTGFLPLLGFSALVLLSAFWSDSPSRTLFYGAMLIANFLVGYALAVIASPRQFLTAVACMLTGLLLVSVVMLATHPEIVTNTRYGGAWLTGWQFHAVFSHKSDAGYYFAMLSLIAAHGPILRSRPLMRAAFVSATLFAIVLTNSATALGAALALNGLLVLTNRTSQLGGAILPIAAILALIFSIAAPLIDVGGIAGVLARDVELTGRVPIWRAGLEFADHKPLLGYGYYAFFDLGTYSPVWDLWKRSEYFHTPHFHNTGIDMLISLGVVGVTAYAALVACAFTVLANRTVDRRDRKLLTAILILFLISAAFDFTLMKHNAFATTFLAYLLIVAQRPEQAVLETKNPSGEPDGYRYSRD